MSFDDRLRDELERQAAGLPARGGDIDTVTRRGARRRALTNVAVAAAMVLIAGGAVAGIAWLTADSDPLVAVTVPTTAPTPTTSVDGPVVPTTTSIAVSPETSPPTTAPFPIPSPPGDCLAFPGPSPEGDVVEQALEAWIITTFPEYDDGSPLGMIAHDFVSGDGWLLVPAEFRSLPGPGLFARSPSGDWIWVWSGFADDAELLRKAAVADAPDLPVRLLDCADLGRFLEAPGATALDASVIERAALGRDVTAGGGSVWVATGLILEPDVETGEILRIDAETGDLTAAYDVTQPMSQVSYTPDRLWIARAGDGALPDNLVGYVDLESGAVRLADLGEFSVVAMVADGGGAWLAQGNGWPPALVRVNGDLEVAQRFDLPGDLLLTDLLVIDQELWVSSAQGTVLRVDPDSGEVLAAVDVGSGVHRLGLGADQADPQGRAVWALSADGDIAAISSDGSVAVRYDLERDACCLITDEVSETVWIVSRDGLVYLAGLDVAPQQAFRTDGDLVEHAVETGNALWAVGDSVTWILLGQ